MLKSTILVAEFLFVGPEPQPIQQPTVRVQPDQQPSVTIINNWPELQRPEPRPRIIYMPSRPRVITQPTEPAKKDTVVVVQQTPQQSSFLSDNGIIWCVIVLGLILFGILGYLIAGRNYYRCNGNCNSCRGGNCGGGRDWNMNHQGHIDHSFPTTFKHEVKVDVTGIPTEITLKTEMPPKVEEKPVEQSPKNNTQSS